MTMDIKTKRRFSAWLLLLVFVPVMVATSLHVHDYGDVNGTECDLCVHHVHHGGHLNGYTNHVFDCPLCQLASLPFVAPTVVAIAVAFVVVKVVYASDVCRLSVGICDIKSTRAPPLF